MDVILNKEGSAVVPNAGKISQRSNRRQKSKFFHPMVMFQHLTEGNRKIQDGILVSYQKILRESPTLFEFLSAKNASKNRFLDIPLNDYSRVILTEPGGTDYYHASYVDGLVQPRQYVLAQAPFSKDTQADFHRLVSQLKPEVVIALLKEDTPEAKLICPEGRGERICAGIKFRIEEEGKSKFRYVKISVSGGKSGPSKSHVFFMSTWVDDKKIPDEILDFRALVQKKVLNLPAREGAALIVCPTGAKRSGVWYIVDTEGERLQTKNRIRFSESIRQLRYQRNGSLDSFELFNGLIDVMERHAKQFVTK